MSRPDTKPRDFWSRRKAGVEAEDAAEIEALHAAELEKAEAEKTDDELLEKLGLPDPDTLGEGDDFTGFMAKAVPQRLRTRALRKLWLTNPTLANLDELVDYGQDFTDAAMAVENIQTAYQVGKGMLTHVLKMEELAAKEAELEDAVEDEPELEEEPEALVVAEAPQESDAPETFDNPIQDEDEIYAPAPRRRMRFDFDAEASA